MDFNKVLYLQFGGVITDYTNRRCFPIVVAVVYDQAATAH